MHWDVKIVRPLSDYRIYVEVEDGRKGIFDMKPYLDRDALDQLKDVHYFNQVGILSGAVTWPNDQDIAPETLLAEMLPVEAASPSSLQTQDGAQLSQSASRLDDRESALRTTTKG